MYHGLVNNDQGTLMLILVLLNQQGMAVSLMPKAVIDLADS